MSTAEFLQEIQERGIILQVKSGEIRYRAPKGSLTPELRAALARHKREIIAMLASGKRTGHGLCTGPEKCAGCYPVGVIDGKERYIHPPKGKPIDWTEWNLASEKVQ